MTAAQAKLSPPQFIPTADPKPIPEHRARIYGPKFPEDKAPEFRRVNEADFIDFSEWLIPRLLEKYERATADGLRGWFHSVIRTNSYAFFRGPNSVLLLESRVEPLEPSPVIRERFLRVRSLKTDPVETKKAHYEEGLKLYRLGLDWAKGIKGSRLEYGIDSDIPDGSMYDAIPHSKKRAYYSLTF